MTNITFNTKVAKEINVELVRNALIKQENATKLTIAQETKLSVATCANILNDFVNSGEAIEIDNTNSFVGRPARCFSYNADYAVVLAIGLSTGGEAGYCIRYVIANMLGDKKVDKIVETSCADYAAIEVLVDRLLREHEKIRSIGISVPGVTYDGKIVECDIPDMVDVPIVKMLEEKHEIPVVLENNMNLATIGYYNSQHYSAEKNLVLMRFTEGVCSGSGIIINGKIMHGDSNFAGEISYLPTGMSRQEQLAAIKFKESLVSLLTKTVLSIIALINPSIIAIDGDFGAIDILHIIECVGNECTKSIPVKHMPAICAVDNFHHLIVEGLLWATQNALRSDVLIVKR